jgi:Arc/MetJ family transcription regulator
VAVWDRIEIVVANITRLVRATAMAAADLATNLATVMEGLSPVVRLRGQVKALDDLAGLGWEGELDKMREGYRPARHR